MLLVVRSLSRFRQKFRASSCELYKTFRSKPAPRQYVTSFTILDPSIYLLENRSLIASDSDVFNVNPGNFSFSLCLQDAFYLLDNICDLTAGSESIKVNNRSKST